MKKILLINCYFGSLPEYFNFYMESVRFNSTVDFLLVTDDKTPRNYPKNLIVEYSTFEEIRTKMQELFDFEIALNSSYKLCDFRPVFGRLFYDRVKNYDFWGYADIDVILGDIRHFITDEILSSYDKIQTAGHFTLMPVTEESLHFYEKEGARYYYKDVYSSPINVAFDEWPGLSTLYEIHGKKVYNSVNDIADLSYAVWYFLPSEEGYRRRATDKIWHTHNIVYLFEEGKLYRVGINGKGEVERFETMYVHFQKRKVKPLISEKSSFLILPPGKIVEKVDCIDKKYLKRVAKEKKFYFAYLKMRIKNFFKKLKGKSKKWKI